MLTLGKDLSLYWLAIFIVQGGMKKYSFSALDALLESYIAITMMMLVLNVLVSTKIQGIISMGD